ncbi:unnamed protein product [Mytilus coruscus]|uniref:C1q domain-containing protein n=1 Tax=Mytilus coruscus TaxID=42192 RepID=A0A6J8CG74_MYTCO|nr:unnamed protein product [Mytilus coruscus]
MAAYICSNIFWFGIFSLLTLNCCKATENKRILIDDQSYVQSQLHQINIDIQDLKTKLAEKDIHLIQMQNVIHGLADRLNQKDNQVTALQTSLDENTTQIQNLTGLIQSLQHQASDLETKNTPIAFYAHLQTNLALSGMKSHQTIIYNTVDLNIGNAYNNANGLFTAPLPGTYVFYIATGTYDRSHASVELVLNGIVKDVSWADSMDHDDRAFATSSTPLTIKAGDIVMARIGNAIGGNSLESDQYIRCSFSGFRLY